MSFVLPSKKEQSDISRRYFIILPNSPFSLVHPLPLRAFWLALSWKRKYSLVRDEPGRAVEPAVNGPFELLRTREPDSTSE